MGDPLLVLILLVLAIRWLFKTDETGERAIFAVCLIPVVVFFFGVL